MEDLRVGDRVRIDIPDETDLDHHLHGRHGEIIEILDDDAGIETGDDADAVIYRIQIDDEATLDFRHYDLRPPVE